MMYLCPVRRCPKYNHPFTNAGALEKHMNTPFHSMLERKQQQDKEEQVEEEEEEGEEEEEEQEQQQQGVLLSLACC